MSTYSNALKHVLRQGNYQLLFKLVPYILSLLFVYNILLSVFDYYTANRSFIIIRIATLVVIPAGALYILRSRKNTVNIIIYELIVALCFPVSQSIPLFENISIWYIYGAVIFGGLFYGLSSGFFLIPIFISPLLYLFSYEISTLLFKQSLVHEKIFDSPGIFIVIWFSAICTSAVKIGFDIFYFLRVTHQNETLQKESSIQLSESAQQKLLLEEELSKLKNVETLGIYAGGIAHDFNNMLTIIAGQMMTLRRMSETAVEKEYIEKSMQAVKKASGLIKKMLLFTGHRNKTGITFVLNESVETVLELLKHNNGNKIRLEKMVAANPIVVTGDANLFETNLINFLVYLIQQPLIQGEISLGIDILKSYKTIQVSKHNGKPLSIDESAQLVISYIDRNQLVLHQVNVFIELVNLVQKMSGVVSHCQTEESNTIAITFPANGKFKSSSDDGGYQSAAKEMIMVIDDDKMVLKSTEEVLQSAGYKVIACNDPDDAVERYKKGYENIGLVLLDMRMPDKSGKEIYYELKKINQFVKVVIVSGYCSGIDVQEMMADGVLKYIEKPYTEEELCFAVSSIMQ